MEAFEVVRMEGLSRRTDDFLQNVQVAFVGRNQVAATRWGNPLRKSKRITNMLIHRNPTRCRNTGTATFGAILDVDLA
ncbi:hypothetical protein D9M71_781240 [compost metagenome]